MSSYHFSGDHLRVEDAVRIDGFLADLFTPMPYALPARASDTGDIVRQVAPDVLLGTLAAQCVRLSGAELRLEGAALVTP